MKSCFGTIYPDLEQLRFGQAARGKIFQICVSSQGAGHRDRKLEVDQSAWESCQRCEDFRNCYDFSMAKLQMQRAILDL